ncbi:MAG: hypothetical protein M0Z51_00730 [Propionibacterium sp.]|nr:hypothetical protein [Propionibacterium sp.]
MELIRAAAYGVAYFMVFGALGAVLDRRRLAWAPLVVDTGLVAALVWAFGRPDAARIAFAVTLAMVCLVTTGLIVWDAAPPPAPRGGALWSAEAAAPPRRAAGPGRPAWRARTIVPPPPPPPPLPRDGQFDWVRPVVEPPRRAVAWADGAVGAPMISEPYRPDPG